MIHDPGYLLFFKGHINDKDQFSERLDLPSTNKPLDPDRGSLAYSAQVLVSTVFIHTQSERPFMTHTRDGITRSVCDRVDLSRAESEATFEIIKQTLEAGCA